MSKCSAAILTVVMFATWSCVAVVNVPEDYQSIQEAIVGASAGDTILLAPGTYVIKSNVDVTKKLTITSNYINSRNASDIETTIIKANEEAYEQWFDIRAEAKDTKIIGLTIVGNRKDSMAIRNSYSEVNHCRFIKGNDQLSFEGGGGLVTHCHFEGAGDDAIDADNSVSWTVEYCTINASNDDGIEVRLHAKKGKITTALPPVLPAINIKRQWPG